MEATLQNTFNNHFEKYRRNHGTSSDQYRAARAIMACGSDELGHDSWVCDKDGHSVEIKHSCHHRSCPKCQSSYTQKWLDKTQARLLPVDHYHVVFTLPHELNEVWQYNREWSTDHLFKAAAETLRQLLKDERYLGADVGILAALHTWGRTLSFHPHAHLLVTGGGYAGGKWKGLKSDYLLPVGVIKAKFKGKWLSWLNRAYADGDIRLPDHWAASDWYRALRRIARKSWNVRIQGPYRHGDGVVTYLSRYVHGGPIRDRRIIAQTNEHVAFRYTDAHDGKEKVLKLKTDNFINRVLWHVSVKGQHNVRYYGLYVPGAQEKRSQIRMQIGVEKEEIVKEERKKERRCPKCNGLLVHRSSTRRKISYIKEYAPWINSGSMSNKAFNPTVIKRAISTGSALKEELRIFLARAAAG